MADLNNLLGEHEECDATTWPELRLAAARWTRSQLANQIQRTGPDFFDHLHPDEADFDLDHEPDFEAEP